MAPREYCWPQLSYCTSVQPNSRIATDAFSGSAEPLTRNPTFVRNS